MSHKCLTFSKVFTRTTATRLNIQQGEMSYLSKRFAFPCRCYSHKLFSDISTNNWAERLQNCLKMESHDFRSKMPLILTYIGPQLTSFYIYMKMDCGMWSSSERQLISCIRSLGWGKKKACQCPISIWHFQKFLLESQQHFLVFNQEKSLLHQKDFSFPADDVAAIHFQISQQTIEQRGSKVAYKWNHMIFVQKCH